MFMRGFPVLFCLIPTVGLAQSSSFVIANVTVKVGDGRTIDNAFVAVADGKITNVSTSPISGGVQIDGKGKFLYPGFIDAYSTRLTKAPNEPKVDGKPDTGTFAPPFMWAGNRKGITSDSPAASLLDFEKDSSSYENGITTALLMPSRGSVRGSAALVNLLPSSAKERVVNAEVGFGLSFRGGGASEGYPTNILGVVALLRQTLADAKSLAEGAEIDAPKEAMKSLTELAPLAKGKKPAIFDVSLDREIERSARISGEFGFPFMVAGGRDAYKVIDLLKATKAPVLLAIDYSSEPKITPDADSVPLADRQPLEYKMERLTRWKEQIAGPAALLNAGISVAFTSGSGPSDYLANVRQLIKNGVSPENALKAMTVTPAKLFGVETTLGSVETGKQANLVLMSAPFESDVSKVEGVWVVGTAVIDPAKASAAKGGAR